MKFKIKLAPDFTKETDTIKLKTKMEDKYKMQPNEHEPNSKMGKKK